MKYFEGEVLALADLAALESHSGTDPALLCSSDSYAIFSLLYYCFPLQSLGCFLQYPSLFYSNEGLSCHSLPGADTYIVAKCFSLLSDNPHDLMCPVCLCSYKLALNNRIVCIPAHKVGRVNKSVCCPRKVSLVDIIVLRLLANLYDNHDALHLHFRWISCFRGHMKGLPCGL